VSPDAIAGLGAFLSGVGSVLGGALFVRSVRRRERADCAQRIADLRAEHELGLRQGLDLKRRDEEP
jgi:hypothetical protein